MFAEKKEKSETQAQRTIFSIHTMSPEKDIESLINILLPWAESFDNPQWHIQDIKISDFTGCVNFIIDSNAPLGIQFNDNLRGYLSIAGYTLVSTIIIPAS